MCNCGIVQLWKCANVQLWKCAIEELWKCAIVEMCNCGARVASLPTPSMREGVISGWCVPSRAVVSTPGNPVFA